MLGLRFCARAFSSCGERGPLFTSRCACLSLSRPLLLRSTGSRRAGSVVVAHGPSCSSGMWDLPRPGLEPVSPALTGRFSTTAPPGKPTEVLSLRAPTWEKCAQEAHLGELIPESGAMGEGVGGGACRSTLCCGLIKTARVLLHQTPCCHSSSIVGEETKQRNGG